MEKTPKPSPYVSRILLKVTSAPLSCPSDNKNIEVTLFTCFLYFIVLKAKLNPELMFVPPRAKRLSVTCRSNATAF